MWNVFQCDVCTRPWTFCGQTVEVALTFGVDADGNAFDSETLEPLPLSTRPSVN